jgi:hypothetical protein
MSDGFKEKELVQEEFKERKEIEQTGRRISHSHCAYFLCSLGLCRIVDKLTNF